MASALRSFLSDLQGGRWLAAQQRVVADPRLAACRDSDGDAEPHAGPSSAAPCECSSPTSSDGSGLGGGFLPLHHACALSAPAELLLCLMDAHPAAARDAANAMGLLPLHLYCENGLACPDGTHDGRALARMLELHPEAPGQRDSVYGQTPLLVAVGPAGCPEHVVHALLRSCPRAAGVAAANGMTPLHNAVGLHVATYAQLGVARALLAAAPHCLRARTAGGWTPLHFAACNGYCEELPDGRLLWDSTAASVESLLWLLAKDPLAALAPAAPDPHAPLPPGAPPAALNAILSRERSRLFNANVEPLARLQATLAALQAAAGGSAPGEEPPPPDEARFHATLFSLLHGAAPFDPALARLDSRIAAAWDMASRYAAERAAAARQFRAFLLCVHRAGRAAEAGGRRSPCPGAALLRLGSLGDGLRRATLEAVRAAVLPSFPAFAGALLAAMFELPGLEVSAAGAACPTRWSRSRYRRFIQDSWEPLPPGAADRALHEGGAASGSSSAECPDSPPSSQPADCESEEEEEEEGDCLGFPKSLSTWD